MKRLLLIRHAKSSWDDHRLSDHERPLNARGRAAAPTIGRWLREAGHVPEHALVSTALRTRQTWDALCAVFGAQPATFVREIYEAEAVSLLAAIRAAPPVARLALVGHNPGIGETARRLLSAAPGDPAFARYPTGAVTIIDFDLDDWAELGWGTGRLVEFVTPKTLPDAAER